MRFPRVARELSGLTKKQIYADQGLAAILGVSEGTLVSYAEIQKGLHQYIKSNHLRIDAGATAPSPAQKSGAPASSAQGTSMAETGAQSSSMAGGLKGCVSCGEQIPSESAFCDLCGARQ